MKTLRYFANTTLVLSLAMFASCSSDNDIEKNDENKESASVEEMVFTASFEGDETTRAVLTKESSSTERMHWQEGDKILLSWYNNTSTGENNKATISKMYSNGTKAEFTGSGIPSGKSYYAAIYPDDVVSSVNHGEFTTEIKTHQVLTSGYPYDKSAMLMIARTTSSYDKNLVFKNVPTLIKVTLTNNDGVKYIRVRSNYENSILSGTYAVQMSNSGDISSKKSNTNNYAQLEIPENSNGTFYLALIPGTPLNSGFTFELEKSDGSIYVNKYTESVTFGRSQIYDFGTFDVSGLTYMTDFVNLDLPSGTLWCTRNITAGSGTSTTLVNSMYDNGGYYAWGDLLAFNQDDGSGNKKTKYNSSTYTLGDDIYTTSGSVSTLKDEYDAAYQIAGHAYCMPTYAQIEELYNNCTVTYYTSTTYQGHYGVLLTSKNNGKTLWLPAAGYHCDTWGKSGLNSENSYSHYWSKSLNPKSSAGYAYCLDFSNSGLDGHGWGSGGGNYYDRRFCGKCIRPVYRR